MCLVDNAEVLPFLHQVVVLCVAQAYAPAFKVIDHFPRWYVSCGDDAGLLFEQIFRSTGETERVIWRM